MPASPLARYRLVSPPPGGSGAIGVVEVTAESAGALDGALAAAGIAGVQAGVWGVRALGRSPGADRAVVARVNDRTAWLMPHAGPALVSALLRALADAGLAPLEEPTYPEAGSEIEARMLDVLATAASPLAVDLLLDQPRRWAGLDPVEVVARADAGTRARWRTLRRLVEPPLVVAWGAPNIGKSSLLNALASANVALAADERGTTRDHVGATLDLAGLVVWYADTPGVEPVPASTPAAPVLSGHAGDGADGPLTQAHAAARALAERADLVLLCADGTAPFPDPPVPGASVLCIALRSDLGPPPEGPPVDARVSLVGPEARARTVALAELVRDRLVPPESLRDTGAWAFWERGWGGRGA
jgi:hypothetical protein